MDLDLLVEQKALPETLAILAALGFKAAVPRFGPRSSGISHYYGSDPLTGKLFHVHLYSSVLTGESFVKSHLLPFERMLLENRSCLGPVRVASKSAELVVFVLRTFIKYGSLPDCCHLLGKSDLLRAELRWLQTGSDISEAVALLRKYCEVMDEPLFLECVSALHGDSSLARRVLLARSVRRRLRTYAKYTPLKRLLAYMRVLWAQVRRQLAGNRKNKRLHSGGAVIAFVGADATGKTALVLETERWLREVFAVRTVHVGKPPSFWLTVPVNVLLPLARRLLPQLRHVRFAPQGHAKNSSPSHDQTKMEAYPSLIYASRAVALAWDRCRLLIKVKRLAANGEIVICDRYPSGSIGAKDSPRLRPQPHHTGVRAMLYNWLAGVEQRLYNQIPPPDIALRLSVSIETAKQRNRERLKSDKHSEDYLESLYQQNHEWHRDGTKSVCDVSTENSLTETILRVKRAIWQSL